MVSLFVDYDQEKAQKQQEMREMMKKNREEYRRKVFSQFAFITTYIVVPNHQGWPG